MKKALLAGAAFTFALTGAAWADIKIATAGPMTGDYATFGAQMKAGAEQAVADINAAGGVMGEQLSLAVEDDRCDPKEAVAVANRVASSGAVLMAGHFCSGSSIPASAVYEEEGVVQISPASTNPKFTDERPGPGIYPRLRPRRPAGPGGRRLPGQALQGRQGGDPARQVAPTVKASPTRRRRRWSGGGKKADLYEAYTAGEQDYTALVTKLKNEGIGVVYVGGYHTEAGLIKRQMVEQGMDAVLDVGRRAGHRRILGDHRRCRRRHADDLLAGSAQEPDATAVVEALRAKGIEPEGYVLYTYAAIQAWAQAVETAKSTEHAAVVKALDAGTFKTVLGTLEFDDKGDVSLPGYVFYEWKEGKYDEM